MPRTLSRITRFCIHPTEAEDAALSRTNSYASAPSPRGLAAWYETVVEVRGEPDPRSGYIIGIDKIDKALKKIEEGEFGMCDVCEEPISVKRLEARPETNLCIRCKEDQERAERDFV